MQKVREEEEKWEHRLYLCKVDGSKYYRTRRKIKQEVEEENKEDEGNMDK